VIRATWRPASDSFASSGSIRPAMCSSRIARHDADGGGAMRQDWQINGERKWQLSIYFA